MASEARMKESHREPSTEAVQRRRRDYESPGGAIHADVALSKNSAHRSPIIMVVIAGLMAVIEGNIEPSAIRRPSTPCTRSSGPTTVMGSSADPIRQVPHGWQAVPACALA